jgi:hypothetical protein
LPWSLFLPDIIIDHIGNRTLGGMLFICAELNAIAFYFTAVLFSRKNLTTRSTRPPDKIALMVSSRLMLKAIRGRRLNSGVMRFLLLLRRHVNHYLTADTDVMLAKALSRFTRILSRGEFPEVVSER